MAWTEHGGYLVREWPFPDFNSAWGFATRAALVCESQGHHADILVGWGRVKISTTTHDQGHQVSEKDYRLTAALDTL